MSLGLKNKFEKLGTKIKSTSTFGKKAHIGSKVHGAFNIADNVVQAFKPLEKVPVIGQGVKVLTGVSGAINNLNDIVYEKSRKDNRGTSLGASGSSYMKTLPHGRDMRGNMLERTPIRAREDENSAFVG